MRLPHRLIAGLGTLLIATLCVGAAAQAQAPAAGSNLPWGLPPLPPGIGPVEKFADISGPAQRTASNKTNRHGANANYGQRQKPTLHERKRGYRQEGLTYLLAVTA